VNLAMHGHKATFGELLMSLAFIPYGPFPILYPAWTLEIIVEFTLILFAFQLLSRPYGVYLSSASVVLIAVGGHLSGSKNEMIVFCTNPILIDFSLGVIIFKISNQQVLMRTLLRSGALPVAAILFICTAAVFLRPFYWPELPRLLTLGIPAAGVLLSAILLERFDVFANSKLVNFLAKCSYSIYLCHWFVNIVSEKFLSMNPDSRFLAALFLAITPVGVTYVAVFVHLYVEAPVTRYLLHRLP
jgi:exopolysaccharide production protein ExoZ